MTSFVRIALAGAGTFAKMEIRAGDDISDLAKRACIKFSHWGVNATQISFYLVAAGGDEEPTEEAISAVLSSLAWAGLSRTLGFPLVARKNVCGAAHSALQATHYWLTAVILRVVNSLMENVGVVSPQWASYHESRVLDGRHDHVGGHLPRRVLNFGVDSGECAGGTLKEK